MCRYLCKYIYICDLAIEGIPLKIIVPLDIHIYNWLQGGKESFCNPIPSFINIVLTFKAGGGKTVLILTELDVLTPGGFLVSFSS